MRGAQLRAGAPTCRTQSRPGGLRPAEPEFRGLAANLLATQEEERRRVSRELHDELGQRLALLEIQIEEMVRRLGADSPVICELEALRSRVAGIAEDVHRICCRLHPAILENLGLIVAVRSYCEEYSAWSGIKTRFSHCGVPARLPPPVALCLYRVVQEGLRNAAKHSRSKRALVVLRGSEEGVHLIVKDSGQGFVLSEASKKGGLGLISLCERVRLSGGICNIHSAPERGTRIQAWVPLTMQVRAS
ncbi:MAG: sensor histidine kinase [Bryobacteraceae bacterium]